MTLVTCGSTAGDLLGIFDTVIMEASKEDKLVVVGCHPMARSGNGSPFAPHLLPGQTLKVQAPQIPVVLEATLHTHQASALHNHLFLSVDKSTCRDPTT